MKKILVLGFILFFSKSYSQDFNGQWRGGFTSNGEFQDLEYVLEFTIKGDKIEGYSYTYPVIQGKKYYDICIIEGTIDRAKKYIEVSEISKVKSNVPLPYRFDCFQIHKLTYFKKGDTETLEGSWLPTKRSVAQCGTGTTVLERKRFRPVIEETKDSVAVKKPSNKTKPIVTNKKPTPKAATTNKNSVANKKNTVKKPAPKPKPVVTKKHPPVTKNQNNNAQPLLKTDSAIVQKEQPIKVQESVPEVKAPQNVPNLGSRTNTIQDKIEVTQEEITVQLYDNGQVDGDTVTVTYNGKVIVSKQRLSEKPITLKLKVSSNQDNEFVMYANNLGSIPPNTALMIVTAGDKRYTTNISSDEKRNGSIVFRLKN